MHPVIRIVGLVVLGTALAFSQGRAIIFATALVCALYVVSSTTHFAPAGRMLARMRWLFLSIVVFYFWFTPGHTVGGMDSTWLPTVEGVTYGTVRVLALVTLVLAVNLLLQTTAREQLLAALLWCLRPLRLLGLPHERLAVRMSLVLHAVPQVQAMYSRSRTTEGSIRARLAALSTGFSGLFTQVIARAESEPAHAMEVPEAEAPPVAQWLYLVLLTLVLVIVLYSERMI